MGTANPQHPPFWCARCGYDLDAIPSLTCPECGQVHTETDRALRARQLMFLELTRMDAVLRWAMIATAAVYLVISLGLPRGFPREWTWYLLPWGAGVLAFVASTASVGLGLLASRRMPTLHRRLFRRAWILACFWVALPLLAHGATVLAAYVMLGVLNMSWGVDWLWVLGVVLVGSALAAPVAWKRSWRRLLRAAALSTGAETSPFEELGLRIMRGVLRVVVYGLLIVGMGVGGTFLLDTYLPHWWRAH